MIFHSRALRALAPLLLLAPLPLAAQQVLPQVPTASPIAPAAVPQYARPDDPWIYRGTDIPVDRQWLFGEMPNGLRYAVRRNAAPPGQVSIRVRIDAGSLHEEDSERGFAHLIEHLVFRQSRDFAVGEAIPYFQRLGSGLGIDTNALTSPTQTVYQIDLPNARGPVLDDAMKRIAGMVREPVFTPANVATEVPIVLAERRERSGALQRAAQASNELFYEGQRLAERSPIGELSTLRGATAEGVQAFHDRWYRPDKAVVVAVGDADPAQLAVLIERHFGDWQGEGAPEPDFGAPQAPRGADADNPVGDTRIIVEPGQPRQLTYAVLRPWEGVVDNLEYNRGLLIDAIAEAIINRRLETRARETSSYIAAGIERDKTSRSADGTYVSVIPASEDWETPLAYVRAVIADALAAPPSQAEIDREIAEYDVVFANMVQQHRNQPTPALANEIVNAVDIREAVASPETFLEVFRGMRDRFTPETIHRHTRELFSGVVVRGLLLTPEQGEADEAALRGALLAEVDPDDTARGSGEQIAFADLPPVGEPAPPAARAPLGLFNADVIPDVEQLTFPNGVRALLWRTENEPGRATVRVRFGQGLRGFARDEAAYVQLGETALMSAGLGSLDQNDLDRIATGRKMGLTFEIDEGTFVFEGMTRAEDVADQLYLFAAKLAMPRWDAAPIERAKASALLAYESYRSNPEGVINRDLEWLLRDRDPRFGTPAPDAMREATPEGFEQVWSRLLAQGPVEVSVFGDFDREAAVEALSRTFGALPPRIVATPMAEPLAAFAQPAAEPITLTHAGEGDQAAAIIAWPTGGGSAGLPQGRKLEVLADLFSNRLLEELRERAGTSYTPFVGADWPTDVPDGGRLLAIAQLPPEQVPAFFAAADSIARDLASTGPTADELARVTEPMRQYLLRAENAYSFWQTRIEGSSFDRTRLATLPSMERDYTQVTPQEIQALAARYLTPERGFRVEVVPERREAVARR
jgi:zinc protease